MPAKRKGFTLIELMVTIAIIAVISAIGITTFNQSQKLGRDSKRKQDIRSMAVALELYYQTNKRYPCTGNDVWVSSASGGNWITDPYGNDASGETCGDTVDRALDTTYINVVPKDPVNTGAGTWTGVTTGYIYGYRGYDSTICSTLKGQFFVLVAQLENKNDPDRNFIRQIKNCDGTAFGGTGWDTGFVVTSDG